MTEHTPDATNLEAALVDPFAHRDTPSEVQIPQYFYWILDEPTPLAGMPDPRWTGVDWD